MVNKIKMYIIYFGIFFQSFFIYAAEVNNQEIQQFLPQERREKRRGLKKEAKELVENGKLTLENYEKANFEPKESVTSICQEVAKSYALAAEKYSNALGLYAEKNKKGKIKIVNKITDIKFELISLESARGRFSSRENIVPITEIAGFWKIYNQIITKHSKLIEEQIKPVKHVEPVNRRLLTQENHTDSFGSKFKKSFNQKPPANLPKRLSLKDILK
jgi:hypothetical protein